jgi:hypothetical protein
MKRYFVFLLSLFFIIPFLTGCYTVLSHPGGEEKIIGSSAEGDETQDYHEVYGYSQYYYPHYWSVYPRWGHYYAAPWWYDYNWGDNESRYNDDDVRSPRPSTAEPAVLPGTRWAEPPTMGVPNITRGSSSSSSTVTGSSAKGNESEKQSDTEQQVKTKDTSNQEKDKKPVRRTGRWGK